MATLLVGAAFYVAFSMGSAAAQSRTTDYDTDDDGLIEVSSLAQFNAMRWDLDGNGTASSGNETSYAAAFPNALSGMGCPSTGCTGYELTANLDFDTNGDGRTDVAGDDYWNGGAGWAPVGDAANPFGATFHGNGHSIDNLFITRTGSVGLFGDISGVVREVQLLDVDLTWSGITTVTGGLAGRNVSSGKVVGVFVEGEVEGSGLDNGVGIVVGRNNGLLAASYGYGTVSGAPRNAGGLVGVNQPGATIVASYAVATVSSTYGTGSSLGGLVGSNNGTVTNSYWDTDVSGITGGKTTADLQSPTGYTGIYADWDDLDGDSTTDDELLWQFGSSSQYPILSFQDFPLSFGSASIPDQDWVVSESVGLTLPEATGGTGNLTYSLTGTPPTGVTFYDRSRQLEGIPEADQASTSYTYTVTDANGDTASLSFTITVTSVLTFGSKTIANQIWEVDAGIVTMTLPEATSGNGALTYHLRGTLGQPLPTWLTFSATNRQMEGTPREAPGSTAWAFYYTATDEDGDTVTLRFTIRIIDDGRGSSSRPADRHIPRHPSAPPLSDYDANGEPHGKKNLKTCTGGRDCNNPDSPDYEP